MRVSVVVEFKSERIVNRPTERGKRSRNLLPRVTKPVDLRCIARPSFWSDSNFSESWILFHESAMTFRWSVMAIADVRMTIIVWKGLLYIQDGFDTSVYWHSSGVDSRNNVEVCI